MFKLEKDWDWFKAEIEEKKSYFDSQSYFFNIQLLKLAKEKEKVGSALLSFLSSRKRDIQTIFLPALLFRYNLLKFPPQGINFFDGKNHNWFYSIENWQNLIAERMPACLADYAKNPLPIQTVSPWRYAFLSLLTNLNFSSDLGKELRVLDIGGGDARLGICHTNAFSEHLQINNPLFLKQFSSYFPDDFSLKKIAKSVTVDLYPVKDHLWYLAGNLFQNIGSLIEYYCKESINPPEDFSPRKEDDIESESWIADYSQLSLEQKEILKKKKINAIFASATLYQINKKDQLKFKKTALEILPEGGMLSVLCSNLTEVNDFSKKIVGNSRNFRKMKKITEKKQAGVFFSLKKENNEFIFTPLIILFYFDFTHNWKMELKNLDDFDEVVPFAL